MGWKYPSWSTSERVYRFWGVILIVCLTSVRGLSAPMTEIPLDEKAVHNAFATRKIYLSIGVGQFTDSRFKSLQFPVKDAQDMAAFLGMNNVSPHDRGIILTDQQATVESVQKALNELETLNTSTDDIVVIYLSTHGSLAYDHEGRLQRYAALQDSRIDNLQKTGIPIEYLQERLAKLKSKKKAMILALCHSGGGKSQLMADVEKDIFSRKAAPPPLPLYQVSSAMMVLTASAWDQPAREDLDLHHDIYTHFLLEGLQNNDSNGDGAVTLFEAHEYARNKTYEFTRGQQTPSAMVNFSGTDPIVLKGHIKRISKPMVYADIDHFRTMRLRVNGTEKGALWEPQVLEPGHRRLTLVDPQYPDRPLMDHYVDLQPGQNYALSSLILPPKNQSVALAAQSTPVPSRFDHIGPQPFAGIQYEHRDLFGSPAGMAIGIYALRTSGHMDMDALVLPTSHQMNLVEAKAILPFARRTTTQFKGQIGFQRLSITRLLSDSAATDHIQTMNLTYPILGLATDYSPDWHDVTLSIGAHYLPARQLSLKIDDTHIPLEPITVLTSAGIRF